MTSTKDQVSGFKYQVQQPDAKPRLDTCYLVPVTWDLYHP